ncbi:MAG TPA: PAS domain S-box protein [Phycisphaerae bacterium]|jgi:PAS domain S-box-containing protein
MNRQILVEQTDVALPPQAFLADVFRHLPMMVIHITTDGIVLHCNPETARVTGYEEEELVGKNVWGVLFPGKLFAQVPRFISLVNPSPLIKDIPMTIRTKRGAERVIAWSRYIHQGELPQLESDSAPRTFICVGVDLTDRLLDAERSQLHVTPGDPADGIDNHQQAGAGLMSFGPHIGNAGAIDSEIITPIAISPRALGTTGGPCPIEQVRDGMAQVETHIHCVQAAFDETEFHTLTTLAEIVRGDGQLPVIGVTEKAGRMAFEFATRADAQHIGTCITTLAQVQAKVNELLASYRPEIK